MPRLPDVLQLGPLALPTFPLLVVVGLFVASILASRHAERWGAERELVEQLWARALLAGVVGAKVSEVLLSPDTYLRSPRLLIAIPAGNLPLLAGFLAAAAWALPLLRGRPSRFLRALDAITSPLGVGMAIASLGVGDDRGLPLAAGFVLVAATLFAWRGRGAFPGHLALAAVVLGGLVVAATDLLRPAPSAVAGVTGTQLGAAAAAASAYIAALWGAHRTTGTHAHGPGSRQIRGATDKTS